MKPAFGNLLIVSQLSRYPREMVKKGKSKKIEKEKSKKVEKEKSKKKSKKEFVFSSLGQNMRLLSLPYS